MRQHIPTILVDQNTLFREGLERLLAGSAFKPIARGAAVQDVAEILAGKTHPVLFMIGSEPGDITVGGVQWVKQHHPAARVVVLADTYEVDQLTAVLRAGAHSYLLKTMTSEVLLKSLEIVMLGGSVFSSTVLPLIAGARVQPRSEEAVAAEPAQLPNLLSNREKQILEGLARGESNKAIARRLSITESTVKVHVKTILRKVKVRNRTQAAVWAMNYLTGTVAMIAASWGLWEHGLLRHLSRVFMLGLTVA